MRKELIESHIRSLCTTFGKVRAPISEDELRVLYDANDLPGMLAHIRKCLSIDVGLRLGLVKSGGPSAPAWVACPVAMPLLGTAAFRSLTIPVYIRKSFLSESYFEGVVCVIAHELCHILLDATYHPLREEEAAVDLTAMLLGFRDFYVTGCRRVRDVSSGQDQQAGNRIYETRTQGYLTYEEVGHAATYMTFRV